MSKEAKLTFPPDPAGELRTGMLWEAWPQNGWVPGSPGEEGSQKGTGLRGWGRERSRGGVLATPEEPGGACDCEVRTAQKTEEGRV